MSSRGASARWARRAVAFLVLALIATACSAGDSADEAPPSSTTTTAVAGGEPTQPLIVPAAVRTVMQAGYGTQDFRIFLGMDSYGPDGELESFYQEVVDQALTELGAGTTLGIGLQLAPTSAIDAAVLDAQGGVLETVAADFALAEISDPAMFLEFIGEEAFPSAELEEAKLVVAITTPSFDESYIAPQPGDLLEIDLGFTDSLTLGDEIRYEYLFGQTLPPSDPSTEVGLTPVEIFVQRWSNDGLRLLGSDDDQDGVLAPAVVISDRIELVAAADTSGAPGDGEEAAAPGAGGVSLVAASVTPVQENSDPAKKTRDQLKLDQVNAVGIEAADLGLCGGVAATAAGATGWFLGLSLGAGGVVLAAGLGTTLLTGPFAIAAVVVAAGVVGGGCLLYVNDTVSKKRLATQSALEIANRPQPASTAPECVVPPPTAPPEESPAPVPPDEFPGLGPIEEPEIGAGSSTPVPDGGGTQISVRSASRRGELPGRTRPVSSITPAQESCDPDPGPGGGGIVPGPFGDVHMITFDGTRFDFQAAGEFVGARTADDDVVQFRMEPYGENNTTVSVTTAVAMNVDGTRVSIHVGEPPRVYVDGARRDIARGDTLPIADGGGIVNTGTSFVVVWPDETTITINVKSPLYFDVGVFPGPGVTGWTGIVGTPDGDPTNDIATRGGVLLSADPAFDELYGEYAESWRVGADESLFYYDEGKDTDTFTRLDFPTAPAVIDPEARAAAERICLEAGVVEREAFAACVLDVALTGNAAFAFSALSTQGSTRTLPGGLVWQTPLPGYTVSGVDPFDAVRGPDDLLLVRATNDTGDTELIALDTTTGEVAQTWPGIVGTCLPGADDELIWTQLGANNGPTDLVVIDPASFDVLATYTPAPTIGACRGEMSSIGPGRVVFRHQADFSETIEALQYVDGGISPLWRRTIEGALSAEIAVTTDGTGVYVLFADRKDGTDSVKVELLDSADGTVIDGVELASFDGRLRQFRGSMVVDGSSAYVFAYIDDGERVVRRIERFDIEAGSLVATWRVDIDLDDPNRDLEAEPSRLNLVNDLLAFWYGSAFVGVAALDTATGDFVWEYNPALFESVDRVVGDADGNLYLLPFAGFVESVGPDGAQRWYVSSDEAETPAGSAFGPVDDDGRLYVMSFAADNRTPIWTAVDVSR